MAGSVAQRAPQRAALSGAPQVGLQLAIGASAVIAFGALLAWTAGGFALAVGFMFAATVMAGALLWRLRQALSPISEIAHVLEVSSEGAGGKAVPDVAIDGAARMRINAEAIAARLEKWKRRPRRHVLTGLPLQDEFLALANEDIDGRPRSVLLGLVRLANYDQVAAYDPESAEHVLGLFAQRLKQALDPSRVIAHIDRDCFAIWFRGIAPHEESTAELNALSYVLEQEIEAGGFAVTPDVQVGSALYPVDSTDAANLLSRAFVSLARPQRTSTGGLAYYGSTSPEEAKRRFSLEQTLRQAIAQQQLEIQYQPIVDLAKGAATGAEALLRWRHPSLGSIAPAEFVPLLEQTGLIEDVGLWTLHTACKQLRLWRDAELDLKLAINLSARQLDEPLLAKIIARTLAAHKLAASDIELELTETAAMRDDGRAQKLFEQFRAEGFGLSIDDFGSGYSSLRYLKNLPFTKLKIDREFVAHVDTRPSSQAICKALIELSNGLGLTVLAEGVERREEVETLRRLGCTAFQGFYFARPMPGKAICAAVSSVEWRALLQSPIHRQHDELRRRISD
jgi:Amt family ammonium transporter